MNLKYKYNIYQIICIKYKVVLFKKIILKLWGGGGGRPKYDDWSQFERGGLTIVWHYDTMVKKYKYI